MVFRGWLQLIAPKKYCSIAIKIGIARILAIPIGIAAIPPIPIGI